MQFQLEIKGNEIKVTSNLSFDNYQKYFEKFIFEFMPIIKDINKLAELIKPLLNLKSWRKLNCETRRTCNIYVVENNLMLCSKFQECWFYETTMFLRTGIGKDASWVYGKDILVPGDTVKEIEEVVYEVFGSEKPQVYSAKKPVVVPEKKEKKEEEPVKKEKSTKVKTLGNWNDEWVRVPGGAYRKPTRGPIC